MFVDFAEFVISLKISIVVREMIATLARKAQTARLGPHMKLDTGISTQNSIILGWTTICSRVRKLELFITRASRRACLQGGRVILESGLVLQEEGKRWPG